jgi:hypothetical protein
MERAKLTRSELIGLLMRETGRLLGRNVERRLKGQIDVTNHPSDYRRPELGCEYPR